MLALDDTGLKKIKVSPYDIRNGDKVLCLFGKGASRHLRVMKCVKAPYEFDSRVSVAGLSEVFPHAGVLDRKYVYGVVTEVLPLDQTSE